MKKVVIVGLVLLLFVGIAIGQDLGEIKKKISNAAKAGNWPEFVSCIRELGSVNSLDSVKVILKMAFTLDKYSVGDDIKADAFEAAREALKKITGPEALAFMREQMLKKKMWEARQLLTAVLGEKGGEENRQALCELIRNEKKMEVTREAVRSLVQIGGYESVDALIDLLEKLAKAKGLPWVDVRKALTTLTGADFGTADKWREYWRVRKEELKANPNSRPQAPDGTRTGLLEEEIKKAPRFFGKEILSRRVCFVIDSSTSMGEEDTYSGGEGGKIVKSTRMEMVKDQLTKLISALHPRTKFNIIAYATQVTTWQKRKLARANTKAKQSAIAFVKKFTPHGNTHTDDALKEAFENKEADTIVLLTDGAPVHTGYSESAGLISKILDFVRNTNRSRKVVIHTFGFDSVVSKHQSQDQGISPQQFLDFLKRLATENGGKYTNIK